MTQSDIYCQATTDLAKAVVGYGDWDFDRSHWSRIIDAMLLIEEVRVTLDPFPYETMCSCSELAMRSVVGEIIYQANEQDRRDMIVSLLAEVAEYNPRLYTAITHTHDWCNTSEGIDVRLRTPECYDGLGAIRELLKAHEEEVESGYARFT